MCILFLYSDPNPPQFSYRLILASNRDEFYIRPSKAAEYVEDTKIISGKDMEPNREGGMWLGVSMKETNNYKLKLAALLNIPREFGKENGRNRGMLVKDYLESECMANEYFGRLGSSEEYHPFNLITIEITNNSSDIKHLCSIKGPKPNVHIGQAILGFGNCTADEPLLKVIDGKEAFSNIVQKNNSKEHKQELIEEILKFLKSDERHLPDPVLSKRKIGHAEYLSSIFVQIVPGGYGTRTHTIILVDKDFNVEYIEHTMEEPIDPEHPKWTSNIISAKL